MNRYEVEIAVIRALRNAAAKIEEANTPVIDTPPKEYFRLMLGTLGAIQFELSTIINKWDKK